MYGFSNSQVTDFWIVDEVRATGSRGRTASPERRATSVSAVLPSSTVMTPSAPDLLHRVGQLLADLLVVVRGDGGDFGDRLRCPSGRSSRRACAARRRPSRRRSGCRGRRPSGRAPAAMAFRPSRKMNSASTVAVVVPSPATSLVLLAASLTSWAPMFSNGSLSSMSSATVTPSLVTVGLPQPLSSTALRPRGPSVLRTARASLEAPARSF